MDFWNELGEKAKALAGSWPSYVALGSFALYLSATRTEIPLDRSRSRNRPRRAR